MTRHGLSRAGYMHEQHYLPFVGLAMREILQSLQHLEEQEQYRLSITL